MGFNSGFKGLKQVMSTCVCANADIYIFDRRVGKVRGGTKFDHAESRTL